VTPAQFFDHLRELAGVPGLDRLFKMMKTGNPQALGFRFEFEAAARLFRNEGSGSIDEVVEFSKGIATGVGKTDIDVVVKIGGQTVHLQCKRSTAALGYGQKGLNRAQAWVAKALENLDAGEDFGRVRYIVPDNVTIPPRIEEWFELYGVDIMYVPHL
jgi:hypothetical protein